MSQDVMSEEQIRRSSSRAWNYMHHMWDLKNHMDRVCDSKPWGAASTYLHLRPCQFRCKGSALSH
jgi:hypothetical protein